MRIVVTGGPDGQVLHSLIEQGKAAGHEIVPLGRPELDLAADAETIAAALAATRPEMVVSAAAYTAVDKAEDEPDLAFAINARGAGAIAQAASDLGVPLVHLSTDYVSAVRRPRRTPSRTRPTPSASTVLQSLPVKRPSWLRTKLP